MLCLTAVVVTAVSVIPPAADSETPSTAAASVSSQALPAIPEALRAGREQIPEAVHVDPAGGGWFAFSERGTNRLLRVFEAGGAEDVALPPRFRTAYNLELIPLRRGWDLLVGRLMPAEARRERDRCGEGWPEPAGFRCGALIVSQLTPTGRWTPVQALPDLGTDEAQVARPVVTGSKVELVWWQEEDGPFRISLARRGGRFSRPRKVQRLPESHHDKTEEATVVSFDGRLWVRGKYVVVPGREHFDVLRAIRPNGRLEPPIVIRHPGRLNIIWGADIGEWFESSKHTETLLVELPSSEGELRTFAVRRRAANSGSYTRPRLIAKQIAFPLLGLESYAQAPDHRLLVLLEREVHHQTVLSGVEVSPDGAVGAVRYIETIPPRSELESPSYGWAGAIASGGGTLVPTTSTIPGDPIRLHPAGEACPRFGPPQALAPGTLLGIFAGRAGVFHVLWGNTLGQLQLTTARVGCG
ncbi:MAG: hypothetical protein JWM60_2533 [Solirubrobacterales bacterium]|nr:hypothetical protein [Solirubrobacterales bacterium]